MRRTKYPCLSPIAVWRCGYTTSKDGITSDRYVFSWSEAVDYYRSIYGAGGDFACAKSQMFLECGKCVHCLARKRRDMSIRLQHERRMHEKACFITLTYNDDSLPLTDAGSWKEGYRQIISRGDIFGEPTLLPSDVQKFMKRLRRHLEYKPLRKTTEIRDHVETPLRYFAVGEYGGTTGRPHYHIIVFGWSPSDVEIHQRKATYDIFRSPQVEKLWTHGFSTVCEVSGSTCNYCAQYVTKKFRRLGNEDVWQAARCPEFVLQSVRQGGMGAGWLDQFFENLRQGCVTVRGRDGVIKQPVPRYYFDRLRKRNRSLWLDLREQRLTFVQQSKEKEDYVATLDWMCELNAREKTLLYSWHTEDLDSTL